MQCIAQATDCTPSPGRLSAHDLLHTFVPQLLRASVDTICCTHLCPLHTSVPLIGCTVARQHSSTAARCLPVSAHMVCQPHSKHHCYAIAVRQVPQPSQPSAICPTAAQHMLRPGRASCWHAHLSFNIAVYASPPFIGHPLQAFLPIEQSTSAAAASNGAEPQPLIGAR